MKETYKHLDFTYLDKYFKDDQNLIAELFRMFLKSAVDDYLVLKEKIKDGNHSDIKIYAHRLKSAFRYIGAGPIGQLFDLIEKSALSKEDIEVIQNLYAETEFLFDNYIIEIKLFLNQP